MNFAKMRRAAGLTQRQVASALGISGAAVAQWELGKTAPKASRLEGIAELFNCTIEQLLEECEVNNE